jgi:hypothetical protein
MSGPSLQSYDSISDRIKQHRQADRRGIVVVEGPSDEAMLSKLSTGWVFFIATTRSVVIRTVKETEALGVPSVAGLVDADFDDLRSSKEFAELPLFTYDEADLEAVLVRGKWFDWIVSSYGTEKKVKDEGGIQNLRGRAIQTAQTVGHLRRANAAEEWGVNFGSVPLHKRLKVSAPILELRPFCDALARTTGGRVSGSELHAKAIVELESADERAPFRGKDAMHFTHVALRGTHGNSSLSDPDDLIKALFLAVDTEILLERPFPQIREHLQVRP